MMVQTVGEIAQITGSLLIGEPDRLIRQVCTDTRRIDLPADSLFIALTGPSQDGHRFLQEAYQSGIRSFLVSRLPEVREPFTGSTFLIAPDTLIALQALAAWRRKEFTGVLIAITGSNGKTIVKEWLSQILQASHRVSKNPKSYNSQIGVPISVLGISGDARYAVLEAGISQPGEMIRLERILKPDYGIITNIGDAHQENFPDLAAKTREKISLFRNCTKIFYCRDHERIHKELEDAGLRGARHSWSRHKPSDLVITSEIIQGSECSLSGIYHAHPVHLTIPFTDPASVENLIHIWLLLLTIDFEIDLLQTQVSRLEPIRMRLEQKSGINRCTLINDYYNSDILSLKIALDLLFQQTSQGRKTVILSDILQSGLPEKQLYEEISRMLAHHDIHRLVGIGPALCRNRNLFSQRIATWPSTGDFLQQVNTDEFHDEAILLKGARSFEFEQISSILEARIHATTLEIRMNDLRYNLSQYRKLIGADVRIMAMVKAFSYGSGGVEMARFLSNERIDYLGVAFIDEGIDIRRAGIKTPVMVMNADFQQSDLIIDHHLEPEIYNWTGLKTFCKSLRSLGFNSYPIHLKIDTGMHRLGFDYLETEKISIFLQEHPEIYLKSVFSHLVASEDADLDDFTNLQIKRFSEACNRLKELTGSSFLRHILNSAGIERFQQAHFEMVRLGIGLYGLGDTGQLKLKPITTLKTIISQVHDLPAGESVGYGRRSILLKPARIGIIPVGYADGIDRRLGNGQFNMLVRNRKVPTIGNICMDMTIIDISGTDANEGDEVIIFGPDNPITDIAEILKTIPYEILTSISPRVKRIYQFD